MKVQTRENTEKTNIQSSRVIKAKIGNTAKMLKMFTKDLYKHPLQTSIQEYINNAKDAHIMVGKDTSTIEITAPTIANQSIIIRDYGPGLSQDDIVDIFANITTSTKDTSDLFIGGFGIGSKSWFAVNTSFIVISVFNNTKTYYTVNFCETNGITISFDHEEKTSEPSGVEVHLPLANKSQIESAKDAIHRAIKFWVVQPKTINLDRKPINFFHRDKDYSIISIEEEQSPVVTLGETQYSIQDLDCMNSICNYFEGLSIVIHFKTGEMGLKNSMEVGPDRESFSSACSKVIENKAKKVLKLVELKLKEYAEKAKNGNDLSLILNNPSVARILNEKYTHREKFGINIVARFDWYGEKVSFILDMLIKDSYKAVNATGRVVDDSRRFENASTEKILVMDKEMSVRDAKEVIKKIGTPVPYRLRTKYSSCVLVVPKDFTSKERLSVISKYFPIEYASKVEISPQVKKTKEKNNLINIIAVIGEKGHNIKVEPDVKSLNSKYLFLSKKDLDSKENPVSDWSLAKKAFGEKRVAVVSEKAFDLLKNLNAKTITKKEIQQSFQDYRKNEVKHIQRDLEKRGVDLMFKYQIDTIMGSELYDFFEWGGSVYWFKILSKRLVELFPKNKDFQILNEINWQLYWDKFESYEQEIKLKKIKIEKDDSVLNAIKSLKKQSPVLLGVLLNDEFDYKKSKKELMILAKSVKL